MNFLQKGLELVKEHPVTTGAVVIVGGLAVYLLLSGGGGSSASGGTTVDTTAEAASADLALQQDSEQFQLAQGAQTAQAQIALATISANNTGQQNTLAYQLGVDQLASQTTQEQDQTNAAVAINQLNTTTAAAVSQAGIQAQVDINQNNNATLLAQEQAIAQEQEFTTAANAQLQTVISNNQTLVANTQTAATVQLGQISANENEYIAGQEASVAKNLSNNGLLGGALGILGAIF